MPALAEAEDLGEFASLIPDNGEDDLGEFGALVPNPAPKTRDAVMGALVDPAEDLGEFSALIPTSAAPATEKATEMTPVALAAPKPTFVIQSPNAMDMADAKVAGEATAPVWEAANKPLVTLPRFEQQESTLNQVSAGIINAGAGLAEGLTSPLNIATLPLTAVKGVGRVAAGVFGGQMLSQVPEQVKAAMDAPTLQGKVEGGLGAATSLLLGGTGVRHAAKGLRSSQPSPLRPQPESAERISAAPDEVLPDAFASSEVPLQPEQQSQSVPSETVISETARINPETATETASPATAERAEVLRPDSESVASEAPVTETLYHQTAAKEPFTEFKDQPGSAGLHYFSTRRDVLSRMIKAGVSKDVTKPARSFAVDVTTRKPFDLRAAQEAPDRKTAQYWVNTFEQAGVEVPELLKNKATSAGAIEVPIWSFVNIGHKPLRDAVAAAGYDSLKFDEWGGTTTAVLSADQVKFKGRKPAGETPVASGLPEDFTSVGASTGADIPAPKTTSTKNAVVDAERAARGLTPVAKQARQANPETWDKAEALLTEKPELGPATVDQFLKGERKAGNEVDEAVLLQEKIRVQNERAMAGDRALDESLSPEERAIWRDEYLKHENRMGEIDEATTRAGTTAGRWLQFRKVIAADDYTLVEMERKARITKGEPLTPEESAAIKAQSEKIASLEKAEAERIGAASEEAATDAAGAEINRIRINAENQKRKSQKAGVEEDLPAQRADILDGIKRRLDEGDAPTDLKRYVQKLAENIVRSEPKIERDALMTQLHAEVAKVAPGLTLPQVRDILSGYGDVKLLNKDAVKVKLRDLKGQLQQVAKIEDMMNRQAPKKTGIERRTPSDEERRLIKQVNELKKAGGFEVTDPAKQLQSALGAVKTRLRNQIADLDHQISTRTRIVKSRNPVPHDAEAAALVKQRDALREQFTEIFGKPEITDAQRLKMAMGAVERSIRDYERRISAGDYSPRSGKRTPASEELQRLRLQRDALRDEYKILEATAHPERAVETALRIYKASLIRQATELQDRVARNDFAKRTPKAKPELDPEALRLRFERDQAKKQFNQKLFEWQRAQRTMPRKMLDAGKEALNTSRALKTSLDLSAVFRQGAFIVFAHPIRGAMAFPEMIRSLKNEKSAFDIMENIKAHPDYADAMRDKLFISEPDVISLKAQEEALMSRWINEPLPKAVRDIPVAGKALEGGRQVVTATQRAYTTFLNKLRMDSYAAMKKTLSADGKTLTPEQGRAVTNFINVATGRGEVGRAADAMVGLNSMFFAPRFVLSRFQLLGMQPLMKGKGARKLIATEYARSLAGLGTLYGLVYATGMGEIEADPRSPDFGKIRIGNTRIDPMGGLSQASVFVSRLATGENKKDDGTIDPLRKDYRLPNLFREIPRHDEPGYGKATTASVMGKFLRTKLAPAIGTGIDLATGQNVVNEPVTPAGAAVGMVTPLSFGDIADTLEEQGMARGTALSLVSLLGMGMQTYGDDGDDGKAATSKGKSARPVKPIAGAGLERF